MALVQKIQHIANLIAESEDSPTTQAWKGFVASVEGKREIMKT